jgi:hypothetical protein
MSRHPRRHLSTLALRGLLAAVACIAAACGTGATPLTDPGEILQKGAASLVEMKSFHLRVLVQGDVALELGGIGGGAPLNLDGTTADGDVDVAAGELAVEILAPALLNLRVNIVVVDGYGYLRAPILTGDSWVRQPAEGGFGGDPGAALAGLAEFLAGPELAPALLPDERCAGTDCYTVQLTVPAAEIRKSLGDLGNALPGLSSAVGDVTVTVGVRKDNLQLATLDLEIPAGGEKPLTIALELTKVNEPVTIEAPPADEVRDGPTG